MSKIVSLDDMRPLICIVGISGNTHIIPQSLFNDITKGRVDVTVIEDYSDIVPKILSEWQEMILRGCND